MTDFDTQLRVRLERLDAAIPDPPTPSVAIGTRRPILSVTRPAVSGRRKRRIVLLVAAALLTAASAVAAGRFLFPDLPQPALEVALAETFAGRDCVTAEEAHAAIRARLDGMVGYADWQIEARPGAMEGRCVYAGYLTPHHVVILFPYVGRDAVAAIRAVGDELLERCLGLAEATELLSSSLTSLGVRSFDIRTDGPQAAPIGETEAYRARVAAGCVLFSGIGGDADGRPTLYLWAP